MTKIVDKIIKSIQSIKIINEDDIISIVVVDNDQKLNDDKFLQKKKYSEKQLNLIMKKLEKKLKSYISSSNNQHSDVYRDLIRSVWSNQKHIHHVKSRVLGKQIENILLTIDKITCIDPNIFPQLYQYHDTKDLEYEIYRSETIEVLIEKKLSTISIQVINNSKITDDMEYINNLRDELEIVFKIIDLSTV